MTISHYEPTTSMQMQYAHTVYKPQPSRPRDIGMHPRFFRVAEREPRMSIVQ
jgi:hypothetical protein